MAREVGRFGFDFPFSSFFFHSFKKTFCSHSHKSDSIKVRGLLPRHSTFHLRARRGGREETVHRERDCVSSSRSSLPRELARPVLQSARFVGSVFLKTSCVVMASMASTLGVYLRPAAAGTAHGWFALNLLPATLNSQPLATNLNSIL